VRLFVAVAIDAATHARVGEVIGDLQRAATAHAPRARITWIPPERLHLTVRFIGDVDEARAAAIGAALKAPFATQAFDLLLGGIGAFPPSGPPRVVWAGIAQGARELGELEREVSERLAACEVPNADRPFRPHLTLARVRDAAGLRTGRLLEGLRDRDLGRTRVDAITLFQSRLSPEGPTYVQLQSTPLRAG
jgi:2'-5' RNA ligase